MNICVNCLVEKTDNDYYKSNLRTCKKCLIQKQKKYYKYKKEPKKQLTDKDIEELKLKLKETKDRKEYMKIYNKINYYKIKNKNIN